MNRKPDILIIEDYADFAETVKSYLEMEEMHAEVASSGEEALELCGRRSFDIALVDMKLPDISGDELLERLRRKNPRLDFIIITGHASLETALKAVRQESVVAYEIKPIDMDRLILLINEVMARKRAEEAVIESEKRYRKLVDNAPMAIVVLQDRRPVIVNNKLAELTGYSIEELMSLSVDNTGPIIISEPNPLTANYEEWESGSAISEEIHARIRRKDGAIRSVRGRITADIEVGGRPAVMVFAEDVTEQERIRENILRSEKFAVIAQLTMGLHHEIRNPLAIITAHVQTLLGHPAFIESDDEDLQHSTDVINQQIARIVSLLNSLSLLGKETRLTLKPVQIPKVIDRIEEMFAPRLKKAKVALKCDCKEQECRSTMADEGRLLQVFANIVFNSLDAMPGGGEIIITAKENGDDSIDISFADDGEGIPETDVDRIFTPFFSTKPDGMGMGLTVSNSIIREHNGTIKISNSSGGGTTVTVNLPIREETGEM